MEGGDISNKPAPAIVIDIDGIIIDVPRFRFRGFGKHFNPAKLEVDLYTVNDKVYPLLENIFYQDIAIYLFAHRPDRYKKALEDKLGDFIYTRLFVGGIREREALLKRRNVHRYYYHLPEHASFLSKSKEKRVEKWNEIIL